MSESRIEYLQSERESLIRRELRSRSIKDLLEIIAESLDNKDADDYKENLIEFIIDKNYMEVE